jgi:hypothetical protein
MIKGFEFSEGGRSYSCMVEERFGQENEHWWWFTVSSDGQRYAPFQASRDDTRTSVQKRIVEFYEHRLWVRAQPVQRGAQFGSRPAAQVVAPAAPATNGAAKPAAAVAKKAAPVKSAKSSAKSAAKSVSRAMSRAKVAPRAKAKPAAKGRKVARA